MLWVVFSTRSRSGGPNCEMMASNSCWVLRVSSISARQRLKMEWPVQRAPLMTLRPYVHLTHGSGQDRAGRPGVGEGRTTPLLFLPSVLGVWSQKPCSVTPGVGSAHLYIRRGARRRLAVGQLCDSHENKVSHILQELNLNGLPSKFMFIVVGAALLAIFSHFWKL